MCRRVNPSIDHESWNGLSGSLHGKCKSEGLHIEVGQIFRRNLSQAFFAVISYPSGKRRIFVDQSTYMKGAYMYMYMCMCNLIYDWALWLARSVQIMKFWCQNDRTSAGKLKNRAFWLFAMFLWDEMADECFCSLTQPGYGIPQSIIPNWKNLTDFSF